MSEPTAEAVKVETTKVKFLRDVDYKGVGFAKGAAVDLETRIADRQIAEGNAVAVTEEKADKKTK